MSLLTHLRHKHFHIKTRPPKYPFIRYSQKTFLFYFQNIQYKMFAVRRSRSTARHGYASPKFCFPFALFRVLDMLSAIAKGRTICIAWWSTILSTRFRKRPLPVTTLRRRRSAARRFGATARWPPWTKATAHHPHIGTAATIQGVL